MPQVLSRFTIPRLGEVVVIHERAKRGDIITSGERSWVVLGVETHAILNPPLPWGFLLGESAPEVGEEVAIVKGPEHEVMGWPMDA